MAKNTAILIKALPFVAFVLTTTNSYSENLPSSVAAKGLLLKYLKQCEKANLNDSGYCGDGMCTLECNLSLAKKIYTLLDGKVITFKCASWGGGVGCIKEGDNPIPQTAAGEVYQRHVDFESHTLCSHVIRRFYGGDKPIAAYEYTCEISKQW